jgi:HEAT repeat protein
VKYALISIGQAATPEVAKALKGNHFLERMFAAIILGQLKDERAVKPLIETLQNEDEVDLVHREAAFALGLIGHEEAIPVLAETLNHEFYYIREAAAWALTKINHEQATEALLRIAKDKAHADYKVAKIILETPTKNQFYQDEQLYLRHKLLAIPHFIILNEAKSLNIIGKTLRKLRVTILAIALGSLPQRLN